LVEIKTIKLGKEILKRGPISSGAECSFYRKPYGRVGYKVYAGEHIASIAFSNQQKAHKAGLAPKPGYFFKTKIGKVTQWGYTTQTVKVIKVVKNYKTLDREKDKISSKLKMVLGLPSYASYDSHSGNFGYIKDKLVAIDFGPLSTNT